MSVGEEPQRDSPAPMHPHPGMLEDTGWGWDPGAALLLIQPPFICKLSSQPPFLGMLKKRLQRWLISLSSTRPQGTSH